MTNARNEKVLMVNETVDMRFSAKTAHDVYSYGFFQGREYEALDSLEAMRTVGEFEERQRHTLQTFEAVMKERVAAAVAQEREACAEACEAQGWSTHSGTFAAAVRARGTR